MVWKLTGSNRQDEGERWGSRRTYWWLLGLFDVGGEPPSSLLLLLEGKDGSSWSVAGKGGGGVLPTGAARAGSQLGRKKNASCSGGCAKGAICSGCGMGCGCVVEVDDGGTDVVGGGQGGGVLNTTAAPPRRFVIGISQATGRCSLALFKVGRLKTGCNGSMLGLFPDDDPATWLAAAGEVGGGED